MKKPLLPALFLALGAAAFAARPYEIAVIPKGTTNVYWKAVHAGVLRAESELNAAGVPVHVIWKGALQEDDREQQIQVVENFIGLQVDGIVLCPLDSRALVEPVEEAVGARIPVVIMDSGLDSDLQSSFVATDNRAGGRLAGRALGRLLRGRGKVILLRYAVGSSSTEEREAGFLEVMRDEFPGIELLSTDQHAGPTRDTARRVAETLLDRYGQEANGVFASNESSSAGMLLALRDAGLAGGRIKFVAFDSADMINEGLKDGDVQGIVVQDPVKMGYLGLKTLVAVLRGQKVPRTIDTGATLATPENRNQPAIAALLDPPRV